jgi:outer membrane autotransporter protein
VRSDDALTYFEEQGAGPNSTAAGAAIDAAFGDGDDDFSDIVEELLDIPSGDIPAALEELSGNSTGSTAYVGAQAAFGHMDAVSGHLSGRGDASQQSARLGVVQVAQEGGDAPEAAGSSPAVVRRGLSAFAAVHGGMGDVDGDADHNGFDYDSAGLTLGADVAAGPGRVGIAGGFSRSNADYDRSSADGDVDSWLIGFYAGMEQGIFHVDAQAGWQFAGIDNFRIATVGAISTPLSSSTDADGPFGEIRGSADMKLGEGGWHLRPGAALSYSGFSVDDYTETAPGGIALAVSGMDIDSLKGEIGVTVDGAIPLDSGGILVPEFRAAYVHEFMDEQGSFTGTFTGAPTGSFQAEGAEWGGDTARLGAGLSLVSGNGWKAGISYDAEISSERVGHAGRAGVTFNW